MIPIGDENPTLRTPVVTYLLLVVMFAVFIFVEGAGTDPVRIAATTCDLGMVPGELTHLARVGAGIAIAPGLACIVDDSPINVLTPLISMFLHGGWGHLLGNALFFWVFGNNIEDSMTRPRFLAFYLLCGLAAAVAHVLSMPTSIVPTVGASGAISGIMGAYLVLYPHARVRMFFGLFFWSFPAWLVLLYWFGTQILMALPALNAVHTANTGGVAVMAHVGGFITGAVLVKVFEVRSKVAERVELGHELHDQPPAR